MQIYLGCKLCNCFFVARIILLKRKQIRQYLGLRVSSTITFSIISQLLTVANVLQLHEVSDFGALNSLPVLNSIRSAKLHLTTEASIAYKCFMRSGFLPRSILCNIDKSFIFMTICSTKAHKPKSLLLVFINLKSQWTIISFFYSIFSKFIST